MPPEDVTLVPPKGRAEAATRVRTGDLIDGKYRVVGVLGVGGMGEVLRVRHEAIGKEFALKLIRGGYESGEAERLRFRREAEVLGELQHENILSVTDFGFDEGPRGLPYLVTELLVGESEESRLTRVGHLELADALDALEGVARALDHAHSHGVMHRDLKPSNVFLCHGQEGPKAVKLLDFGVARKGPGAVPHGELASTQGGPSPCATSEPSSSVPLARQGLTEPGWAAGTRGHIAPERVLGVAATTASDIFELGILAHELLTGRLPERNQERGGQSKLKPASTVCTSVPSEVDEPLERALSLDPSARQRSAQQLVDELRQASSVASVRLWRLRVLPWRALTASAAVVVASGAMWLARSTAVMRALEGRLVDARIAVSTPRAPDARLIEVVFDESSLRADPAPLAARGNEIGGVLWKAYDQGIEGAAIDMLLPARYQSDTRFQQLLERHADRLVLAVKMPTPMGRKAAPTLDPGQDPSSYGGAATNVAVGSECVSSSTAMVIEALGPGRLSRLFASIDYLADSDGHIRRIWPAYRDVEGGSRTTLAFSAATLLSGPAVAPHVSQILDTRWDRSRLERLSWQEFKAAVEARDKKLIGRFVLLGEQLVGSGDEGHLVALPGSLAGGIAGIDLQALTINTWLAGCPLRGSTGELPVMALLATTLAAAFAVVFSRSVIPGLLTVGAGIAAFLASGVAVFLRDGVVWNIARPLLSSGLAVALSLATRSLLSRPPVLDRRPLGGSGPKR